MKDGKYVVINFLRPVGPGAVNRGKSGELKSIEFGGEKRARESAQKGKNSRNEYFKMTTEIGEQSRSWGHWIFTELRNRKVSEDQAKVWAKEILDNFLGHNTKKAEEKKKAEEEKKAKGGKAGKEVDPLISETVRLFPEEKQEILTVIEDLAKGKLKDPKTFQFSHTGTDERIAFDGRMRPTTIVGAVSMGHAFGVTAMATEADFFVAKDDFRNEAFYKDDPNSSAHMGTSYLAAPIMHNCVEINRDQLVKNLNGDKVRADKAIGKLIEAICLHGSRSSSTNGSQTHTNAAYVVIEKMNCPRSLGTAFEQPVNTLADAVKRIRSYRESLNKVYQQNIPSEEMYCYVDGGDVKAQGNIEALKSFAIS